MNQSDKKKIIANALTEALDLPTTAYEKAKQRYEDLGAWFSRDDSPLKDMDPHIFPQGSFRLGTVIRPVDEDEEYDLDLACKLRNGVSATSHTQKQIADLVGIELHAYKERRKIQEPLVQKHRCWRLGYRDTLKFHMDVVPCVPAEQGRRQILEKAMIRNGLSEVTASSVASTTVLITDDRHQNYDRLTGDWGISNPEGYARWFEERISLGQRQELLEKAQVDQIPLNERVTPLQQAIRVLKRHRDQMFRENCEAKPISIILTTLAAMAYSGEQDTGDALVGILSNMDRFVRHTTPRVPNPVDPNEDFADKWSMEECQHLALEKNFRLWLQQARTDFDILVKSDDASFIHDQVANKFGLILNEGELKKSLGTGQSAVHAPKAHVVGEASKPWRQA